MPIKEAMHAFIDHSAVHRLNESAVLCSCACVTLIQYISSFVEFAHFVKVI